MEVQLTPTAEIAVRALGAEDRSRVNAWLDLLKNWGNDPFTMRATDRLPNLDLRVLRGSNDLRIYFSLDEAQKTISVVDIAKHSVLGTII